MQLAAIVAMSENHVIGLNNKLPWHLPADLQHFKKLTMGKPIIMGRKTFESIGKPLPGRKNIIITQNEQYIAPGCEIVHSVDSAIKAADGNPEIFIIGGAHLFQQTLPRIDSLYLTLIHQDFEGDTYFPELNKNDWEELTQKLSSLMKKITIATALFI